MRHLDAAANKSATEASSAQVGRGAARTSSDQDDAALVTRLLGGDEAAFGGLVEQYHGRLMRLARVFIADRASAEEVVQDTWLAVLTGLPSFEGRSRLKTWIFSILANRARTRGQRDKRTIPFSTLGSHRDDDGPAVSPSRFRPAGNWAIPPEQWDDDTPEQLLLRDETRALIDRTIATLPEGQRAVITMRDIEGLDSAEVCNILEISETNQRVLLHRARARVRSALEQHVRRR